MLRVSWETFIKLFYDSGENCTSWRKTEISGAGSRGRAHAPRRREFDGDSRAAGARGVVWPDRSGLAALAAPSSGSEAKQADGSFWLTKIVIYCMV